MKNGKTLLEILARDMEVWESDSSVVLQNSVGHLFSHSGYRSSRGFEVALDWHLSIVAETQWKEARAAYLASQNKPEQGDGWIEWNGGKCPVAEGVIVDVRRRDGGVGKGLPALVSINVEIDATSIFWRHDDDPKDIVAYRIVAQQEQEVAPASNADDCSQALIWLGEDKSVQVRYGIEPRQWLPLLDQPEWLKLEVMHRTARCEFRLAPKTIKVGARTIEAPLMDLKEGDEFWWCESTDRAIKEVFKDASEFNYKMRNGRCYATERAAIEADAAITALLTGKE